VSVRVFNIAAGADDRWMASVGATDPATVLTPQAPEALEVIRNTIECNMPRLFVAP
jgi:hypothetical protein